MSKKVVIVIGDRMGKGQKVAAGIEQAGGEAIVIPGMAADNYYNEVHTVPGRRASDCLECGKCEKACPQHLPIRQLLKDVAKAFEKA